MKVLVALLVLVAIAVAVIVILVTTTDIGPIRWGTTINSLPFPGMRRAAIVVAMLGVLCGCSESNAPHGNTTATSFQFPCGNLAPTNDTVGLIDSCPANGGGSYATTTTTPTPSLACAPSRDDCSTDEVIATVRDVYVAAGTKTDAAACVAAIEGHGKHALVQLLTPLSVADSRRSVQCVASEARLDEMHHSLSKYLIENLGR